jgi:hypothetical protein
MRAAGERCGRGAVNGRNISFIQYDDAYSPPKPIFDTSSQQVVCKSLIRMVAGSIFANL